MLRVGLFKGIGWNGFALVINRSFPILLTIILASFLKPSELGDVSFILSWLVVLSVFADWGVAVAFQKFLQEYSDRDDLILSTALTVRLCFTLAMCVLCWLIDAATGAFRGYGFRIIIALMSTILGSGIFILNAQFRYMEFSMLLMLQSFVWFASSILMVWLGFKIDGPIFGAIFGNIAVGIAFFFFIPGIKRLFKFDKIIAREILNFGIWATIITGISTFTAQAGVLMLPYLANTTQGGIFRIATIFSSAPVFIANAIVFPFLPLCKKAILKDKEDASKLITLFLRYLILIGCITIAVTYMIADAIIRTLINADFVAAVGPLKVMVFASVPMMLFTVFSSVLFIGEGIKALSKINVILACYILIGNICIIPTWGGFGAAIVSLSGYIIGFALIVRWLKRRLHVQLEWRKYAIYALCCLETIAAVWCILLFIHHSIHQFVSGLIFGCTFFAIALRVHRGIDKNEMLWLLHFGA